MDAHSSREEAKKQSDTDEEWDWYIKLLLTIISF
jgi:hypothetical protein